jgi:hypothetical protein
LINVGATIAVHSRAGTIGAILCWSSKAVSRGGRYNRSLVGSTEVTSSFGVSAAGRPMVGKIGSDTVAKTFGRRVLVRAAGT